MSPEEEATDDLEKLRKRAEKFLAKKDEELQHLDEEIREAERKSQVIDHEPEP